MTPNWYVRYKVRGSSDGIREMETGLLYEHQADCEMRDIQGYEGIFAVYKIRTEDREVEAKARAEEIRLRTAEPPTGYWSPE